jgi:aminopeptidase N
VFVKNSAELPLAVMRAPVVSLSSFFRQWLARTGSPVVESGWRYDSTVRKIVIDLTQAQPGEAYRLPLEVGIITEVALPPRIEKIDLTQKQQRFEIADKERAASS